MGGGSRLKSATCDYTMYNDHIVRVNLPSDCGEILYYKLEYYEFNGTSYEFVSRMVTANNTFELGNNNPGTAIPGATVHYPTLLPIILLYYPKE